MENLLFIGLLTFFYGVMLWWGYRVLPGERWQMLAAVPWRSDGPNSWRGVNLTYYGFFQASSQTFAVSIMLIMMGSVGISPHETALLLVVLLGICLPASHWVARIIEKKIATYTVAGAVFVGMFLAPWLVWGVAFVLGLESHPGLQLMVVMAAMAVSYALGEGLGRLACISFGCCYGKPLDKCPTWMKSLFRGHAFIFKGATKKIAYESGMIDRPVLPVQALTFIVCGGIGLVGLYLFLSGRFSASFLLTMVVTQGWRAWSETLRADYRGGGRFMSYQIMAIISIAYIILLTWFTKAPEGLIPQLRVGLVYFWSPGVLITLEVLWAIIFIYLGRSKVTASKIHFHVRQDQI